MTLSISRRRFLAHAAASLPLTAMATQVAWSDPTAVRSSDQLKLAVVGCGGKGWHNVEQLKHENIVALCDVDRDKLDFAAERYPLATKYRDYRKMFDAMANNIDAVVVSTPDHTHAPATSVALDLSKHVYCEKPLTHTVQEARLIANLAAQNNVVTQMGTQIHAGDNYRRVVEVVQSGVLGPISDVYVWCNKGWGGGRFNDGNQEAPATLDWDLFLGPAPERPYSANVHPGNWRRFWDYGAGTFGDMACHIVDLVFWALELTSPTYVEASGSEVDAIGAADRVRATYHFPQAGRRGPVKLHWSDGGLHHDQVKNTQVIERIAAEEGRPPEDVRRSLSEWGIGALFVGENGALVADYGRYMLLPQEKFVDFVPPQPTIPSSVGHWKEWTDACRNGSPTTCNFSYAGRLTETVLLGVAAFRYGKPFRWNAEALRSPDEPNVDSFIEKDYREGFELAGAARPALVPS